ncbi:MAG: hypothetical protein KDD63_14820 [Bacteroidetes bacterium]|nr:hypothetical protein [Bacteroidota bacterium]MCB0843124.1 hypothetical protein [Bacteroidota bacterium]MCB0853496.1 hypothetical protein [Bacteroidota bacterium]
MKTLIFGILIILTGSLHAQLVKDGLFNNPELTITEIPAASNMDIDDEGNILLIDPVKSQVFKLLKDTRYDSSIVIGGRNQREEGFLSLKKVVSKNRQSIYILDDADRRITLLNTNLKIIGNTHFLNLENFDNDEEIYPISFDISIAGEQYVLNQQDNRIYKFNPFGKLENVFGGLDYGAGSLFHPVDVIVSANNFVYVVDTSAQNLMVFDNYGVFRYKLEIKAPFRWSQVSVSASLIICYNQSQVYIENIQSGKNQLFKPELPNRIRDVKIKGSSIYLLTEKEIFLYKIKS